MCNADNDNDHRDASGSHPTAPHPQNAESPAEGEQSSERPENAPGIGGADASAEPNISCSTEPESENGSFDARNASDGDRETAVGDNEEDHDVDAEGEDMWEGWGDIDRMLDPMDAVPPADDGEGNDNYEFGIPDDLEMEELQEIRLRLSGTFVRLVALAQGFDPNHLEHDTAPGGFLPYVRLRFAGVRLPPPRRQVGTVAKVLFILTAGPHRHGSRLRRLGRRIRRFNMKEHAPSETGLYRLHWRAYLVLKSISLPAFGEQLDEQVGSAAALLESAVFGGDPVRVDDVHRYTSEAVCRSLALARRTEAFIDAFALLPMGRRL